MSTSATTSPQSSFANVPASHTERGVDAWLLQYAPNRYVALPLKSCQEIIDSPEVLTVPSIRGYAMGMLQWRSQWLPLIDLNSLLSGEATKPLSDDAHCLVVAYHTAGQQMNYVALTLPYFPYLFAVGDNAICALPSDNPIWQHIATSCFRFQNYRVPIVDGAKLFTVSL